MTACSVGVVGAGPAGLYTAAALLRRSDAIHVTLYDALPGPFGLLEYGVAPDHARIRALQRNLGRVLADPRVRTRYGVRVGRDVTPAELRARHDAVVYATGAPRDRSLDIPGIELPGVRPAGEVVAWYNGRPGAAGLPELERAERAAVVGHGNVALDLARVLLGRGRDLGPHVPPAVAAGLRSTPLREVHLVGRGGPLQARFTPKELRELREQPGLEVRVDGSELAGLQPATTAETELLGELKAAAEPDGQPAGDRLVHLHFGVVPERVVGADAVRGVLAADGRAFEADLLLTAIGFLPERLDDVDFDDDRVCVGRGEHLVADGPTPEYAVGWCRRGARGVLGSARADAEALADLLVARASATGALSQLPTAQPLAG